MGKAIMIQGTASGAGKSTFVTGLCRTLTQAGYTVAPFKAQNMSSNAHTFDNGMQMAKSQAIAAYACGIEPETDMNPVLLKPTDISGSEVILNGNSIGNLMSFEYDELKKHLSEQIMEAYNRLLKKYDIVVVEGAGSPVELNLKENDVVNMGFAKRADCPVLLIADISRGGVFASAYGTIMLLDDDERALVKGLVVNKFCGYKEYFNSGAKILENITTKPVLGVIPHTSINIEDEDCLTDNGIMKTQDSIESELETHMSYREYLDTQFDQLAEVIKKNCNLEEIIKIIGV